jgi:hypothetical protein
MITIWVFVSNSSSLAHDAATLTCRLSSCIYSDA